jgi:hypothetical protein
LDALRDGVFLLREVAIGHNVACGGESELEDCLEELVLVVDRP